MADPVIALGCDIGSNGKDQTPKWSDDKIKCLWSSLLNLEFVSKCHEDLEVQGILLLLETIFSVFTTLKKKYDDAESACHLIKHDLESAKKDLCRVKEDVKCHTKVYCERCPELERELGTYKKRVEHSENRIKSIVSILSMNNSSEDSDRNLESSPRTAIVKAYDLVSQMLLDDDITNIDRDEMCGTKSGIKRLGIDYAKSQQVRTLGKKRKKQNKMAAEVDISSVKEREEGMEDLYYGVSLAPESVPANKKDVCSDVEQEIVPETLCCLSPAKFNDMEKTVPHLNDIDVTEKTDHIRTTPKKQVLQEKITQRSSPILGGCGRKSTHKIAHCNNYNVTTVDRPRDSPVLSQTAILNVKSDNDPSTISNCKSGADRSPSLLKIQPGASSLVVPGKDKMKENDQEMTNEKHGQNVLQPVDDKAKNTKVIKADFWKLRPMPHGNVSNRNPGDVRSCRLKQTTLSLACVPKKQDLSTLKEFNGGVRQSVFGSSALADEISGECDEETSLKLALQESLNENKSRELGPSDDKSPGIRNLKSDSAEDDDDLVPASPNALHPQTSPRQKPIHTRDRPSIARRKVRDLADLRQRIIEAVELITPHMLLNMWQELEYRLDICRATTGAHVEVKGDNTSVNALLKKECSRPAIQSKDADETLFDPLHTSTLQDGTYGSRGTKRVSETEAVSSEQDFKQPCNQAEIKNRKASETLRKHDCSFDRIPEKVSTSPNYKYRRDAVRNREARRKLDGWECEQCKNYYTLANVGADPTTIKRHLNQCSRHRDKYGFRTNTPPGFWNVNFPNTEDSKLEDTIK